ncbi:hypothetical protein BASA62_002337 [Batrachochytrium salamandrivorans]|nr:hypothetical protein BASA62_002337 [Batrachochytrium salamandrivorans]
MPSALGTDNDVFTLNVQGQLVRSQRWFWSRRTKQLYRNRYWLTPQVRPKTVKQRHSFALMETLRTCGDSASLQKYVTRQLLDTSGFFKDPSFDQSRAHGTRYLMLARMDALWTARKAIQIGILVDTHPFSVDHCILCDQQLLSTSIAHLVVECEQVTGHRIQSGLVPAIQKSRLRLLGRALDPGVENVYTWLRGGVLNGEADLDQRWLDGTVEHESMGTRHDNRALAARLADFLQFIQLDIRLHGQLVSRVESYKYLGVLIDSKLDHSAWLKQKRSALEHTISALHPVLANHQLTVNYRSRIFSAVVMGKAYYGLELVGGNKSHLAPLQTTINKGIRLFTGARLSTAIGPLLVETGIGSLLTRSLVSRVRLLERSVTKRTPINAICSGTDNDVFTLNVQGQLVRSQRWFWSRRTKQLYRNRYWLTPQVRPKTVKQRHSFALMETLRTCGDSASLQKYLMLARMDALWTARKAIQIGILVDTHPFSVDHCILCDQQLLSTSIAHLVVECEQVTGHRIQSGLVPAIQKSRLRLLGRALDPGVENVYTWLRGGVLNGEADLDQRWLDGTVEHESMGTRHDNRALAARLADFLQVAYRQYQSTLWKYHRDRLVEVG